MNFTQSSAGQIEAGPYFVTFLISSIGSSFFLTFYMLNREFIYLLEKQTFINNVTFAAVL